MKQKIILTPFDRSIAGKHNSIVQHVYVLLDSMTGGFDVELLDCTCGNQQEFIYKNVGSSTVVLKPVTGQYIDDTTAYSLSAWQAVRLWSDLNKRWLIVGD